MNPEANTTQANLFTIKPLLQLGDRKALSGGKEQAELIWLSPGPHDWAVSLKVGRRYWRKSRPVPAEAVSLPAFGSQYRQQAVLDKLPPGGRFHYRIYAEGRLVFSGSAVARHACGQPFSFAVAGDVGQLTDGSAPQVAAAVLASKPDFFVIPGDVVYSNGLGSQYLSNFLPVFNGEGDSSGSPVLRSMMTFPALGNKDVNAPDSPATTRPSFTTNEDVLAYFQLWSLPLNGPPASVHRGEIGKPQGSAQQLAAFQSATGERFPRMANYSFDWGNTHWVVLDSNMYVDLNDPALQAWLETDLSSAVHADWKFVVVHHPPFSSDLHHADERRVRVLAPLFQKHGVDIVFAGHNHTYERTMPLQFTPAATDYALDTEHTPIDGTLVTDTAFNGQTNASANGVMYIVQGGGGAGLDVNYVPPSPQPFSAVFQVVHGFGSYQIYGRTLVARQLDTQGRLIDSFTISK